jgi:drug/metabolite transporter (DMT)-like permease
VLAAGAATSWGAQTIVAKLLLTSGLPATWLVSARTALAVIVLTAATALVRPGLLRVHPGDLWRLALLGTAGMSLSNYTYYLTLTLIPVAMAAILLYMTPLFVLAGSILFFRERLRRQDLLAAAVTIVGAVLLVRVYESSAIRVNALGLTLGIFNAISFAFLNLWAKTLPPRLSPWTVLVYAFAAGTLFWLPLSPPWQILLTSQPTSVWLGLGIVTVFGTLLPYALYFAALTRISAAHVSVTSTLEPVVSGIVAFAVLGEILAPPQLAGGALVLAGIALLHVRR